MDRTVVDCTTRTTTVVAMTPAEIAALEQTQATAAAAAQDAAARDANRSTLVERAEVALAANAAFLAIPAPTQAQTLAHVKVLTKENTALIRLALSLLDSVDGT